MIPTIVYTYDCATADFDVNKAIEFFKQFTVDLSVAKKAPSSAATGK